MRNGRRKALASIYVGCLGPTHFTALERVLRKPVKLKQQLYQKQQLTADTRKRTSSSYLLLLRRTHKLVDLPAVVASRCCSSAYSSCVHRATSLVADGLAHSRKSKSSICDCCGIPGTFYKWRSPSFPVKWASV